MTIIFQGILFIFRRSHMFEHYLPGIKFIRDVFRRINWRAIVFECSYETSSCIELKKYVNYLKADFKQNKNKNIFVIAPDIFLSDYSKCKWSQWFRMTKPKNGRNIGKTIFGKPRRCKTQSGINFRKLRAGPLYLPPRAIKVNKILWSGKNFQQQFMLESSIPSNHNL